MLFQGEQRLPPFQMLERFSVHLYNVWMDWYLGLDTYRMEPLTILDELNPELASAYGACSWKPVYSLLKQLKITENDSTLDLGSGKGRALIISLLFPFREIIGVELSKFLLDISKNNLSRYAKKYPLSRVDRITLFHQDAASFKIPDSVNYIFMFNPFRGAVLHQVIENIAKSILDSPRPIYLIYGYPLFLYQFRQRFISEEVQLKGISKKKWRVLRLTGVNKEAIIPPPPNALLKEDFLVGPGGERVW